jgi:hypothetical protein
MDANCILNLDDRKAALTWVMEFLFFRKMSSLIVNFAIINVVLPGFRVTTIAFLLNTIINYGKKLYNNQTSVLNSLNILIANGILYYIKP